MSSKLDAVRHLIQQPFMQAYEFRDGLICRWRDYDDSRNMAPPAQASTASGDD